MPSRGRRPRARRTNRRRMNRDSAIVHAPPIVRYTPNVFGFPDRLETRLRYCDYHNLTSTSGSLAKIVYRWNSTFDPNQSGVGHQPLYRDIYAGIYDQYAVIDAYVKVTIVNPGTVSTLVGLITDDDSTTSTTFQTLMEQSHGTSAELGPVSSSKSEIVLSKRWLASEILNIDPYTDSTYKTAVGSDPTEGSIFTVWAIPVDGSSTNQLNVTIELIQKVLWTELSTPTQS